MKYINLFFLLSVLAPMAVRADVESNIGATVVPFQRIFDAVQEWPQLYDTDFVFLLGERVADKKYTLQKVAQACIDYADYSDDVNPEICKEFVAAAFGQSDVDQPVIEESSEAVTDGVTLTTTDDMPEDAKIKITINAAGHFEVDCDNDGKAEHEINSNTIVKEEVLCKYDAGGVHNIKITGLATNYPEYDAEDPGVIYFNESPYLESVQGSLGSIFPTLDGVGQPNFAYAFSGCTNLTTIPPDLFAGVTGKADGMFDSTFLECESLTTIPKNLFKGVTGAAAKMFASTFLECESLTTIPKNLFKGVTGAAEEMFFSTFDSCTGLREIPTGLFDGVNAAADGMFRATFYGCNALTTIPDGLFDGVNAAAEEMFYGTFYGCSSLTDIPEDLFKGVTGKADGMFDGTFDGVPDAVVPVDVKQKMEECNLPPDAATTATKESDVVDTAAGYGNVILTTTSMTPGAGIKITIHAAGKFYVDCDNDGTVEYPIDNTTIEKKDITCEYDAGGKHEIKITGLATDYPEYAFDDPGVIYFNEIPYLESVQGSLGSIFPTLDGVGQPNFAYAFSGCTSLTTIPPDLFKGVTGAVPNMFEGTFEGCTSLTTIPEDLFSGVTDAAASEQSDAADKVIEKSGGAGTKGVTLTTTYMPAEAEIKITIYAAGKFNVDCDDGKPVHTIDNTTINIKGIECSYPTGGVHEIKITGLATDYPAYSDNRQGVIYFNESEYLESVQGSLGSIFPTLDGGKQPNFAYAFDDCTSLTTIPPDLFKGVTGAAEGMFFQTFDGCSELTAIPDGLFDGVNVAAAEMFRATFYGCSALTDIPAGLFEHVTGAAEGMFRATFQGCSSLTDIPAGLFKGVKGKAANMFRSTFSECTNLTTIPPDLFKGVKGKADGMFFQTFSWCTNLTTIPPGLFDGVTGAAAEMFSGTFWNCTHLTKIPDGLFDGVNAAAAKMFYGTFQYCSALTTIPEDLFDGVTGKADDMFTGTFGRVPGVPDAVNAKMEECNIPSDGE